MCCAAAVGFVLYSFLYQAALGFDDEHYSYSLSGAANTNQACAFVFRRGGHARMEEGGETRVIRGLDYLYGTTSTSLSTHKPQEYDGALISRRLGST